MQKGTTASMITKLDASKGFNKEQLLKTVNFDVDETHAKY